MAVTATPGAHDRHDDDRLAARRRRPKVVLISLDGAKPELIERYLRRGVLDWNTGLGRIKKFGVSAAQNITATPSVTAVSHIAIATGSTAPHNDISANTFHPVAGPIIGQPQRIRRTDWWLPDLTAGAGSRAHRRAAVGPGCEVAAARSSPRRGPAATVPRSASTTSPFRPLPRRARWTTRSPSARSAEWVRWDSRSPGRTSPRRRPVLSDQIEAAGRRSYSPIQVTTAPIETIFCAAGPEPAAVRTRAARGTDAAGSTSRSPRSTRRRISGPTTTRSCSSTPTVGVPPGPFALPSTGPAYARAGGRSAKFFFEGSGSKVGTSFFVNRIAPDLSTVRFARYGANFIPRNSPVLGLTWTMSTGTWGSGWRNQTSGSRSGWEPRPSMPSRTRNSRRSTRTR